MATQADDSNASLTLLRSISARAVRPDAPVQDLCAASSPGLRRWLSCEQCSAWRPPDLTRALNGAHSAAALRELLATRQPPPRRMPWFICLTKPHNASSSAQSSRHQEGTRRGQRDMVQHARSAVLSALLNAPSLVPHVVYMHHAGQSFEPADELQEWLRLLGVRTISHRLSFAEALYATVADPASGMLRVGPAGIDIGTYCRMDVPFIARRLAEEEGWAARGIDVERVLYTDTDVLFAHDAAELVQSPEPLPTYLMGTEVFSVVTPNAGVALLNCTALMDEFPAMLRYAQERRFHFYQVDQSWFVEWFMPYFRHGATRTNWSAVPHRTGWGRLEDALWNARGFAHPPRNASSGAHEPTAEPRLWHWHGYKARDVQCWLRGVGEQGEACAKNHSGEAFAHGACGGRIDGRGIGAATFIAKRFIAGAGCAVRQPVHKAWGGCAFRTYAYLLHEHMRLLWLADKILPMYSSAARHAHRPSSHSEMPSSHMSSHGRGSSVHRSAPSSTLASVSASASAPRLSPEISPLFAAGAEGARAAAAFLSRPRLDKDEKLMRRTLIEDFLVELRAAPPSTSAWVLDVGANAGTWSWAMLAFLAEEGAAGALAGKSVDVVIVEPQPVFAASIANRTARANAAFARLGLTVRTQFVAAAAWSANGTLQFAAPKKGSVSGSLLGSASASAATTLSVPTFDLAAFVAARLPPEAAGSLVLAKCDVEGAEFTLLPWLLGHGALCRVSHLLVEWHLNQLPMAERLAGVGLRAAFPALLEHSCVAGRGPRVVMHDELAWNNDGVPVPGLRALLGKHNLRSRTSQFTKPYLAKDAQALRVADAAPGATLRDAAHRCHGDCMPERILDDVMNVTRNSYREELGMRLSR